MPSKDPATRATIAKIAARSRWGTAPQDVERDRRELELRRVESHIRELVNSAPPLTDHQRSRLAVLLSGAVPQGDVA